MAKYRQVHTKIWKDEWFGELSPQHKLFFVYLFTNELASISGLYELPKRVMSFESGLSYGEIDTAFIEFSRAGKAYYDDSVVWVVNLRKYHETSSPKVQSCIQKDIDAVKDCEMKKKYLDSYGIDTLSIPENNVYIPRSSSSSGFSSLDRISEYITELSQVAKETYASGFNEEKYESAAYTLIGWDVPPSDVAGFSEYWSRHGWHNGKPALKNILDHWHDYKDGRDLRNKEQRQQPIKQANDAAGGVYV